jgi:diacylglycerol kinase (ATP)
LEPKVGVRENRPHRSEQPNAGPTVLLVNTRAKAGQAALTSVRELLEKAGVRTDLALALNPGRLKSQILQLLTAQKAQRILVGGGDGSLSCAADVLAGREAVLGVLPLGTGNDFARSLGLPLTLPEACEVIAQGHERRVDVGCVNGRFFLNAISIGITARMAKELDPELKRKTGKFAYTVAAVKSMWKHRPFEVELETSDRTIRTRALQLVIGNGRFHGAGRVIAPEAEIDDHLLNVYLVEAKPSEPGKGRLGQAWVMARVAARLKTGNHVDDDAVLHLRAKEVRVNARPIQRMNIDGELAGKSPMNVSVVPGGLRVFAPRD